MINKNSNKLYRYFIIYFILQITSFMFIYTVSFNSNYELRKFIITPLIIFLLVFTNVYILYLLKKIFILNRKSRKFEIELIKYDYLEDDLKLFRKHRHDMKNHLTVIYELSKNKSYDELIHYTKEYLDKTSNKLSYVNTGVDEVDVLLCNKFNTMKSNNIKFEYHCSTKLNIYNNSVIDLISIISNIIDNAIDANKKIKTINDRMINITIDEDPVDYIIILTNSFNPTNIKVNNFSLDGITSKKDNKNHGLGLGIVNDLINKYKGNITVEIFNEIFYQIKLEIPKHMLRK